VAEARRLDAPLNATTAGQVGNVIGTAAMLAPTAMIPGANTMLGAAAIGAGTGLAMPSESTGETLTNVASGGALGPAALGAGRLAAAGYQGAKALVSPFFSRGQEGIAANTMRAFASNPQAAAARLGAAGPSPIPGSAPTMAEIAGDPGLAQLQRTLVNNPDSGAIISQRLMDNNVARVNALADIAGDEGKRALFKESRDRAARELYQRAFDFDPGAIDPDKLTPALKGEVTKLLKRPSIQQAMQEAKSLAAEEGMKLSDKTSLRGLHYTKLALDDQIEAAVRAGNGHRAKALTATKDKLVGVLEKLSDDYAEARITYQKMSEPINQMDVAQLLLNRVNPPLAAGGQLGANKAMFGRAMQNADQTARTATKFAGAKMDRIMTPEQMATLRALEREWGGLANAENLGRATGSNTGQNLVSQNVLRQTLGPLGLPESWAENTMLQSLMRPVQFAGKLGEQRVTPRLAQAAIDPKEAARLLKRAEKRGLLGVAAPEVARYLPAMGAAGAPDFADYMRGLLGVPSD
jgi:hypothetical protein